VRSAAGGQQRRHDEPYPDLAAINPGNSGGALENRFGQVIGINSASSQLNVEGIGFAIPSADAQPVVEDLIAYGYVKDRVALGVMVIALSPSQALPTTCPARAYIFHLWKITATEQPRHHRGRRDIDGGRRNAGNHVDLLDVLETHKPAKPCGWRSKSAAAAMSSPWTRCWPRAAATEASKQKAPRGIYPAAAPLFVFLLR
jgi:hypothetical protein